MKMRYLLAEPELAFGRWDVKLRTARELSGLGQSCACAAPQVTLELSAVHRMLAGDPGQAYVNPSGEADQSAAAWDDWESDPGMDARVLRDAGRGEL